MSTALKVAIIAAHFFIYLVAAINIWIFSQRSEFYRTVVKLRSLPLIYCGFACFAISTSYEIAEHIGDDWLYKSHISPLNHLFYTFTTAGICLIALGLRKSRLLDVLLIASLIAVPLSYGVNDSKSLMLLISLIPTIIFVYNWYVVMRDWRVFLFLLFSNVFALGFGVALIATGQQVLHLFVGPASAIGLLILGYVAWVKPKRLRS
ncbi:hypothetical protein H6F51_01630 [Cyanobacteria bacterium FACHB-DQ100]|nr:hypothetical protein [Cyanobacteria bacterium FACHB-DQ100]